MTNGSMDPVSAFSADQAITTPTAVDPSAGDGNRLDGDAREAARQVFADQRAAGADAHYALLAALETACRLCPEVDEATAFEQVVDAVA